MTRQESNIWFVLPRDGKPSAYDISKDIVGRIPDINRVHLCDSGGVCRKCGGVMPSLPCTRAHSISRSVSGKYAINYICKFNDSNGDIMVVTLFFQKR